MKKFEYFLVGVFAALGAAIVEILADTLRLRMDLLNNEIFFLALFVLIEELAKFFAIRRKINSSLPWRSVLGECFWIGLGFGILELGILSLNGSEAYAGNGLAISAILGIHILTALLTGLGLTQLRINGYYTLLAITPAFVLHLAFNYWVFTH